MLNAPDLNVISVIDPSTDGDEVEIRPAEMLQVVLTDCKNVCWRFENTVGPVSLRALRHESYYSDGIVRNDLSNFQITSHTNKLGAIQQHFWFRIDPKCFKAVQELERSYNELGEIVFFNDNGVLGRVSVWLLADKEDIYEYISLMDNTILAGKDPIANAAKTLGLSNRIMDQEEGYILNPGWDEQVTFDCCQKIMMVELAEPYHAESRWVAFCNQNQKGHHLGVSELASRTINGARVQRFLIKNHLKQLPVGFTKMRLGDVTFRLLDNNPKWDKKINFFVARYREPEYCFGGEEDEGYDEEEAYYFMRQVEAWNRPKPLRKVPVKIEELDVKGDLTAGAKLIRVFLPKRKNVEIVDPADLAVIDVPLGEEFVIQLYKDLIHYPPNYQAGEWKCEFEGKMLKSTYVITDNHRQRFFFEVVPQATVCTEILTFKMRGKVRQIHVTCPVLKKVQEVKVDQNGLLNSVQKILDELLENPTYDWRTTSSLAFETQLNESSVVDALESLEKLNIVKRHPAERELWGHTKRVSS